ncbi:MAG: dGTP triphosphohydrolase [candidate division WOR-3 bacterium]
MKGKSNRESYEKVLNEYFNHLATHYPKLKDIQYRNDCTRRDNDKRTFFQQDRDRIQYSKAFRRLMHKTQVQYTQGLNVHIRNRLTHSLEVAQIGRSIARNVKANEDLTEAICLGHDLGHTPFGHAGERALQILLSRLEDIELKYYERVYDVKIDKNIYKKTDENLKFFHNFQSLRVVEELENLTEERSGLKLLKETMDGILKHTEDGLKENNYLTNLWLKKKDKVLVDFLESKYPITLEGHIAKTSDKIAQVTHDLEDFLCYSDVEKSCSLCNEILSELKKLKYFKKNRVLQKLKKQSKFYSHYQIHLLISELIGYFINKSSEYIIQEMIKKKLPKEDLKSFEKLLLFDENLELHKFLKERIDSYYIRSSDISRLDGKGIYIIRKIFNAYITNPRQLPDITQQTYFKNIKRYNKNLLEYKKNLSSFFNLTKFRNGDKIIENFYEKIKKGMSLKDFNIEELNKYSIVIRRDPFFFITLLDYISGMTDDKAYKDYSNLYN